MLSPALPNRSSPAAAAVFDLLNPIPFGFFVGALIFDVVYARSADILWFKAAAWLIAIGLIFAIVPRLINLVQVWIVNRRQRATRMVWAFWLNLFGIAAAIFNAFVHSRDAYAMVPQGVWLSALTVLLLTIGNVISSLHYSSQNIGSRA